MSTDTPSVDHKFVAELSAEEFTLLASSGWEPLGFVSGDCVASLGGQSGSPTRNTALTRRSEAMNGCASPALTRMRDRAAELGATGVLGVQLRPGLVEHEERAALQTYSATGTAVRRIGSDAKGLQPFTTHLCAADVWTLLNAGCRVLGLVFGFGVYQAKRQLRAPSSVEEITELTESIYSARETAVKHMQGQAAALRATGVIAVEVDIHTSRHLVLVEVRGTAIKAPAGGPTVPLPRLATDMTDRSIGALVGRGRQRKREVTQMAQTAATEPVTSR